MSYEALAFLTGLFGSLHCVAMCGPLILAMPFSKESIWNSILQRLLYQSGRILMYGVLGLGIGFIGTGFSFLGLQQTLSFITGVILLIAGINYFITQTKRSGNIISSRILNKLSTLLGKYLSKPYGGFFAGAINGILPCGVTYIALAQAVNLNSPFQSGEFMLFFGLGTLPLLLLTAISPLIFRRFKTPAKLVPFLFLIAGSFLIVRGLNLHIPFISHAVNTESTLNCD